MSDDSKTPKLHITAIGGLEEVGKNLTIFQYKNEILVVDCGLRFAGAHLPGVDYLINDFSYLEANRDKIVGLIITHGHLDHIGAIPHFLKRVNVPVYATPFTRAMIEKMVLDKAPEVRWKHRELKAGKMHHIGSFHVEPIHVNHSIIQSLAFAITTPVGVVIHSGDFKIDMSTSYEETTDLAKFTEYGDKGVLALLSDSTNAINPGYTVSEGSLPANFEKIVTEAKGRVIVGTFSSQIHRIQMIIDLCKKVGRRIFVSGRSMLQNLEIGVGLSLFKNYQEVLVLDSEIKKLPKEKILILSTGSQGEETAGLSLMIANKHKVIKLDKDDTVVFSSSAIPGNESAINRMINALSKRGIRVITNKEIPVHTSGHGYQEELKTMIRLVRPRYFMPVHGENIHLLKHRSLALSLGISAPNIFILENGQKLEISKKAARVLDKIPLKPVYVENDWENEVTDDILADRLQIGKNGVVIYSIRGTEKGIDEIEIVNKGFLNRQAREGVFLESKKIITEIIRENPLEVFKDKKKVENQIKKELKKFFFNETGKNPMVVVFILFHVKQSRNF